MDLMRQGLVRVVMDDGSVFWMLPAHVPPAGQRGPIPPLVRPAWFRDFKLK